MTEKTLTTENIRPALDALRGELAPWPVVAKKQDRLNTAQLNAANSGITSSLVAQIIANTAAIRALESAITGTGLRALVVSSLPAIGTQGILYIVPVTTYDPDTDADVVNYSNEYIWIPVEGGTASEGHYEQVGQTGIVINNGQLTITVNGTSVGTFTANQSGDTTAAITVPTNADYVDRTTDQTVAGVKTFSSTINGTAAKAIADEDGTSIKTGYGKLAGSQTWTGENSFSKAIKVNGARTAYILPESAASYSGMALLTYGVFGALKIGTYTLDANNNPSLDISAGYINVSTGVLNSVNIARLEPKNATISELGSSSYQWSSVYAQTYYYNGTAWGLDKENTWTGENIFSTGDYGQSIWLKNTTLDLSVNGNTGLSSTYQHIVKWVDKNNTAYSIIQSWTNSFENVLVLRSYYRTDANTLRDSSVRNMCSATTKAFYPETNADTELGTSTNKWKTLNGINPGALSLPDSANAVNIDITNWDKRATNNVIGSITASMDGWINVQIQRDVDFAVWVIGTYRQLFRAGIQSNGKYLVMLMLPVTKNATVTLYTLPLDALESDLVFGVYRFYPCLGNV